MRVLILGLDGYLGWSLAKHLAKTTGHLLAGVDNYNRRNWVASVGGHSATHLPRMSDRLEEFTRVYGKSVRFYRGDLCDAEFTEEVIRSFKPDAIVHLAEQPSAPFSMLNRRACVTTYQNNLIGTLNLMHVMRDHAPHAHLIKLGCYDDQTEVLTARGWVFFKELEKDDRVCCLKKDTEEIVYQHPTAVVEYPHMGKMLKIETKSVECVVTPNHRVVFRRPTDHGENGKIEVGRAENLPDSSLLIPRGGQWRLDDVSTFVVPAAVVRGPGGREFRRDDVLLPMDRWLAFFGLWLSDGTIRRHGGRPTTVRISVKKERKVNAVRSALKGLEVFHWTELVKPSGIIEFDIANVQLAEYLSRFGTARHKHIPRWILTDCSARQLRILFDSLIEGDGYKNDDRVISFSSTSRQLLDDVQELCLKIGMVARLCFYENGNRAEMYLSFGTSNVDAAVLMERRKWIDYDGVVYCCTVPSGIIMTRRNGKVCWSGNTMGEYGTPNVDIPEGEFVLEFRGRQTPAMFPRNPASFYHACYDDQTEIWTDNGWKLFADLEPSDKVAAYDTEKDEVKFEVPSEVIAYDYDGPMYHLSNRSADLLTTPDHRMWCGWKGGKFRERLASECLAKPLSYVVAPGAVECEDRKRFKLPGCTWSDGWNLHWKCEKKIEIDDWLHFLGWYLSEGSVDRKGPHYRVALASDYDMPEAVDAFSRIGFGELVAVNGKQAVVSNKQLAVYLRRFGKSADRYIPGWVKNLPPRRLRVLLDSLMRGDGHFGNEERYTGTYHTISAKLADDVQEVALRCGLRAGVAEVSRCGEKSGEYRVNISPCRQVQVNLGRARDKMVSYSGKVYCCQVSTGYLLVRRNGKPIVAGNTKVHDTTAVRLACRVWGLRSTDIMQGVVYGLGTQHEIGKAFNAKLATRFDFDAVFGTVINRFCAQAAVGHPITVYGTGEHKRGFLPLSDAMQCLTIAIENEPAVGEYRTWNQFDRVYTINELAQAAAARGKTEIVYMSNPRAGGEHAAEHYYNPDREKLTALGYVPSSVNVEVDIGRIVTTLMAHCKERIAARRDVMLPDVQWNGARGVVR